MNIFLHFIEINYENFINDNFSNKTGLLMSKTQSFMEPQCDRKVSSFQPGCQKWLNYSQISSKWEIKIIQNWIRIRRMFF